MSRKILLLFLTLPLMMILSSWSEDKMEPLNLDDEIAITNQLIRYVNDHRLNVGKPMLIRNETADKLAEDHCNYMISMKKVNSDNFFDRLEILEQMENAQEISENVGVEMSVESAMSACVTSNWLKINVEGDFTHTGIAVRKDKNGQYYFTQLFYR